MKDQKKAARPGNRTTLNDVLRFIAETKSKEELRAIQIAMTNQALRPTIRGWNPLKDLGLYEPKTEGVCHG